jgi:hypothetical protein
LVVLERNVVLVHVDDVIRIVYPESEKKNKRKRIKITARRRDYSLSYRYMYTTEKQC